VAAQPQAVDAPKEKIVTEEEEARKEQDSRFNRHFLHTQAKTKDKGNRDNEFDLSDVKRVATPMQTNGQATGFGAKMGNMQNVGRPLADETARLRDLKTKRSVRNPDGTVELQEVPLFTDEEIGKAIYMPLMRENVLPRTFVPDHYSDEQRMFDATNDFYIKDCLARVGEATKTDKAELAKDFVQAASIVAQGALNFTPFGVGNVPTMITQAIEYGASAAIDIGVKGKEAWDKGELSREDVVGVCENLASMVGSAMAAQMNDPFGGDFYGRLVEGVSNGLISAPARLGGYFSTPKEVRGPFPWDGFVADILSAVAEATDATSDKTNGWTSTQWTIATSSVKAFKDALENAVPKFQALQNEPAAKWTKPMLGIITGAFLDAGKEFTDLPVYNQLNNEPDASTEVINQLMQVGDREKDAFELMKERLDKFCELTPELVIPESEPKPEELDAARKAILGQKKLFAAALEQMGETDPMLATENQRKSIGELILQIKKDQAKWELAKAVATGPAIAEQFLPVLRGCGGLTKFIIALAAAVQRWKALEVWLETHEDAVSSDSHYTSTIQNFVDNQRAQKWQNLVQAFLLAVESATGFAAAAYAPLFGVALIAKGAVALENATYKLIKQMKADKAWEVTKKALANPKDRRAARDARRLNPTLAKYSIAYGAAIERDPIAMTAMKRCGLDRETLSKPEANVELVKMYLEALYTEDSIVLGDVPDKEKGEKRVELPAPALTLRSWRFHLEHWRSYDALVGDPPYAIALGLKKVETALNRPMDQLRLAPPDERELRAIEECLNGAIRGLEDFIPTDSLGHAILSALPAVETFKDLFSSKFGEFSALRNELEA
jgi:hypothetical protein